MSRKFFLILGFGAGYVLGSRAGRQRYEQIKRCASKIWNSKQVQGALGQAEDFAKEKAPELSSRLEKGARFVVSAVSGTPQSGAETTSKPPASPRKTAGAAAKTATQTPAKSAAKTTAAAKKSGSAAKKPAAGSAE